MAVSDVTGSQPLSTPADESGPRIAQATVRVDCAAWQGPVRRIWTSTNDHASGIPAEHSPFARIGAKALADFRVDWVDRNRFDLDE